MRIKNFASLIILLNSLSCSNCSKQESKSTKNEVGINNEAISKLESCDSFPREVNEPIREIIKNFRGLYEYDTLFGQINKDQLDIIVNSVTNFLNKIKNKSGENIVDKVKTLKKIVDTYTEQIKRNSSSNNDSNNKDQDFLKEIFIEHIEYLYNASKEIRVIEKVFDDFNQVISNYHSGKTFEISEQQQQTLDSIKYEFGTDCPINRIAKKVLENLTIIFDNNNEENKKIVDEIRTLFVGSKDQILTKDALSTITQEVNAKIITLYKNLVLQSVANLESCKNIFKNLGFDISFSNKLEKDINKFDFQNAKDIDDRMQQFLKTYADSFKNTFDQSYNVTCNLEDGKLCLAINDFTNINSVGVGNFQADISALCNNGSNSALALDSEDGVGFIYINHDKDLFQKLDNQLFLTTKDKVFENIQFINLGLSCGFVMSKTAAGTVTMSIEKTIQCDPDILFQNIGDPYFGALDESGAHLLDKSKNLQNDGFECFNYNRYNQVVSLIFLFNEAKNRWNKKKNPNNNRPFFSAAWFVHNVANYIENSTNEGNIQEFPDVTKNILKQVNTKITENYTTLKTNYIDSNENNKNKIKLALVEYGVMHSGSFNENVHFDLGVGDHFTVRNGKGFEFGVKEKKMNTLAVWTNKDTLGDFDLNNINGIDTLNVNDIFDINKTIIDGAKEIYQAALNKHLNDEMADFIKFRNNFYSNYPKGILSTKDSVTFIKYVTDLAILKKKMTMLYNGHHTANDIFGKVIIELLNKTYNDNIIYHAATCLVNKLGSVSNYLKFFKIKGVENTFKDHIMVNCGSVRADITIPQIDKVECIADIDNLEISLPDSSYVKKADTIGLETVAYHIWNSPDNDDFNFDNINFGTDSENEIKEEIKKRFDAIKIHWYQIAHDTYKGNSDEKRGGVLYIGNNPETSPNDIENKYINKTLNGFCVPRNLGILKQYAKKQGCTIDRTNRNFTGDGNQQDPWYFSGSVNLHGYNPTLNSFAPIFEHFLALDNTIFNTANLNDCRLFDFDYQGSIDLAIYENVENKYGVKNWQNSGRTVTVPNFGYK